MKLKITLDLPEDGSYVSLARQISLAVLQHLQVSEECISEIQVIISELCANACIHAKSKIGMYKLTMTCYDDKVVISVDDKGRGFSTDSIKPVGTERPNAFSDDLEDFRIGGFGIPIVEALSTKVVFRKGNRVGMKVVAEKSYLVM